MKNNIFATVLTICFLICFAIATDLTGSWRGTLVTPRGEFLLTYTFRADSGKLTGTVTAPQGRADITDGTFTGNDLTFNVLVQGVQVRHTGKYYPAADSIGMDINYNGTPLHATLQRYY